MYRITCDGLPILDLRNEKYIVTNPKCILEVNTVGGGSFTIFNDHPNYHKMQKKKSIFEIADDVGVIFRGRMTKDTIDFNLGKAVDLEGLMAFFNDSVIAPFNFPDDFAEDEEYLNSSNVVRFFLNWIITQHNSQVQDFQKFKLGQVTVTDPNNYLSRSSAEISSTWSILKSKLFESALGGYLCIRYEADGNYIDYVADFELTNNQKIAFGENLLDLSDISDATTTYSAIVPIGAEIKTESLPEGENTEVETTSEKLTFKNVPDGAITEDIHKVTLLNGLHALYSKSAVENYGWVCAPVSETTWDDVTELTNLKTKAIEYLAGTATKLTATIELKAADLHFTDKEIQSFRIYRYVNITSAPHNFADRYKLTKLELFLLEPQNTTIVLGETQRTLIDKNYDKFQNAEEKIESTKNELENKSEEKANEVLKTIVENRTELINTANEIILGALSSYTEIGDFESYKETISTQLKALSDGITISAEKAIEAVEKVNQDLQEKYNTITKHFTFDIDGLTIGQVDNPYKVIVDNDRYEMTVNDIPVMWIENGKTHTPEIEVTKLFKIFDYEITQDSKGIVNCAYVGG